jgi:hypothetical protein
MAATTLWSCPEAEFQRSTRRLALTAIERNHSSGQTVIQLLQRMGHSNLFVHRRMNVRGGKVSAYIGWVTDGTTRMPLLDNLAALIREGTIEIFSRDTIREMFSFVRGDDGRPAAQEGTHDDRVISLSIAAQMVMHHRDEPVGDLPDTEVEDSPTGLATAFY